MDHNNFDFNKQNSEVLYSDDKTLQVYNNLSVDQIDNWDNGISHTSQYFSTAFPEKNSYILDIGIGSGRDMCLLFKMGYNVYGVEPSEKLINETIKRHSQNINDISNRLIKSSLPFLTGCQDSLYDGILCTTVLMHIPEDQLVNCVKNIKRILKNNGHLLLSVPINTVDENMPLSGLDSQNRDKQGRLFNPLSEKKLRSIFEKEGFTFTNKWIDADGLGRSDRKLLTLLFNL